MRSKVATANGLADVFCLPRCPLNATRTLRMIENLIRVLMWFITDAYSSVFFETFSSNSIFAGCPQADLREDLPSTKFDKCGGYVEKTDKVYRVYQFSSCIANITCNQPSQIIGAVTSRFTKLFYCGDVTIY